MRIKIYGFLLALGICLHGPFSDASSPALGADLATLMAQRLLAAPPLPSLDGGGVSVAPQYGYVEIDTSDSFQAEGSGHNMRFEGKSAGNTGGLSLSGSNKSDWGFFVFGVGSKISGRSETYQDGVHTYDINNVKAASLAGAAGLSYRLMGDATSTLALGYFAGPAMINVTSSSELQTDAALGSTYAKFHFNPKFQGLMHGLQMVLRLGPFRINPYLMLFQNFSDKCQSIETEPGATYTNNGMFCDGQANQLETFGDFPAVGLFLGYRSLRMNVYSFTPSSQAYKVTSISGSLGYTF